VVCRVGIELTDHWCLSGAYLVLIPEQTARRSRTGPPAYPIMPELKPAGTGAYVICRGAVLRVRLDTRLGEVAKDERPGVQTQRFRGNRPSQPGRRSGSLFLPQPWHCPSVVGYSVVGAGFFYRTGPRPWWCSRHPMPFEVSNIPWLSNLPSFPWQTRTCW